MLVLLHSSLNTGLAKTHLTTPRFASWRRLFSTSTRSSKPHLGSTLSSSSSSGSQDSCDNARVRWGHSYA